MPKTAIRIYVDYGEGPFDDRREEYDLENFGGDVLPAVGDRIVTPWVPGGLNRSDPENREVYEVRHRYFLPNTTPKDDELVYLVLVVRSRGATDEEVDIVTKN